MLNLQFSLLFYFFGFVFMHILTIDYSTFLKSYVKLVVHVCIIACRKICTEARTRVHRVELRDS